MGDTNPEIKTGTSSSKPPINNNGGPIIKESQESEEYQQDLQVVLGTAFGVIAIVGLTAVGLLLYRVYKARQRALSYTHNDADSVDRNISIDIDGKCQSMLLLLYSYDCPLHQRVVEALAGFLMEVCGVTVTLDILEEAEITERGIDDWLVDRLQEADYILVVCSLGARLRCSKKHIRFKHDGQHMLPDYFAVAVDYVAEKMRVERQKGLRTDKVAVAFMEYSTRSDIPPQLETAKQFCLMRDLHSLHMHLNTYGPESEKSETGSHEGDCEAYYHETETGALLKATIEQATAFFKENPTWMADRLEHMTSSFFAKGGKHRKRRRSSLEQPLLVLTNSCLYQPSQEGEIRKPTEYQFPYNQTSAIDLPDSSKANPGEPLNFIEANCTLNNSGICQNRQNSLPSSLTSGVLVPHKRTLMSKSMDSFCVASRADHEGVPCLFCGSYHMDGRPECKHQERPVSMHEEPSQESLSSGLKQDLDCSRSQTVLHAEVHQEWGTPIRGHVDGKSNTFGGDARLHAEDYNTNQLQVAYKSLPPHHPAPNSLSEWEYMGGRLHRWKSGMQDSLNLSGSMERNFYHQRKLSQTSVFTDESGSFSDTDSLERDLRSIQNISSFHEFVNSSSFVSRNVNSWQDSSYPLPSFTRCPPTGLSNISKEDYYSPSGAEIEMRQIQNSPIV